MKPAQDSLQLLQARAEDATQEALRHLAELQGACRESEARLDLLQRYRDEYRAKLDAATVNGMSALQLNNFRAFLAKLEEAIAQQDADVAHWHDVVLRGRTDWQDAERRARSFGVLNDRRAAQVRHTAERREQKQNDEYAARLAARPRWTEDGSNRG